MEEIYSGWKLIVQKIVCVPIYMHLLKGQLKAIC